MNPWVAGPAGAAADTPVAGVRDAASDGAPNSAVAATAAGSGGTRRGAGEDRGGPFKGPRADLVGAVEGLRPPA
jgi:hypothetical protein